MNRKAFTLIELLAVIILLGILTTIAIVSYTNYLKKSRDNSFMMAENSFKDAVLDGYADCETGLSDSDFCKNHTEPDTVNETDRVYLYELINDEYLEAIKNPYNTNEDCDTTNSYIEVTSNINVSDHSDLSYKICLMCGNKSSEGCN